jgi:hypothetical protein
MATHICVYHDWINDVDVKFRTDARQDFVTGLEFNGEWFIVREILRDWGYEVIEGVNLN